MATATQTAKAFFRPAATWTRDALQNALRQSFERTVQAGRLVEDRVLRALRGLEVPASRVDGALPIPIEQRDEMASHIARAHASLAAVWCGAAESLPVAGLALELFTLAELNVVQVDQIAQAYGFKLGDMPDGTASKLPMGGARALLLVPILGALNVRALERDGKMETLAEAMKGAARRKEWQAIGGQLAAAAALGMMKRIASKPLRRMIPFAGSAIAAWSGYTFTRAVGDEAQAYFRDLATGNVTVRGRVKE